MSGRKSRNKGKRGEREWRDFLRGHGLSAKRGQQRSGLEEQDVICEDLPGYWFEVKRAERFKLYPSMEQAENDAGNAGKTPVVAHRRNHHDWVVVMKANDWIDLVKRVEALESYTA